MQDDPVRLILDCLQSALFQRRGVREQTQGVVGMRREHDLVVPFPVDTMRFDLGAHHIAAYRIDRRTKPQRHAALSHGGLKPFYVFDRPALNGVPLVLSGVGQQGMVIHELNQSVSREVHHLLGRRRPDRAGQRKQVVFPEPLSRPKLGEKGAEVQTAVSGGVKRVLVELVDIAQHAQELRVQQVLLLRKNRCHGGQCIFDTTTIEARRKAHVALGDGHIQGPEQAGQVWIIGIVEDDETGIDRLVIIFSRDDCPRVAAKPWFRFVKGYMVIFGQHIRCAHSRNPCANHGYFLGCAGAGFKRHTCLSS